MYALHLHPEAVHREIDDAREYEILCILSQIQAEAARKVPEWRPYMRRTMDVMDREAREKQHGDRQIRGGWYE